MVSERKKRFQEVYETDTIPWDTGITPPEIISILQELELGVALDLGCGTGTVLQTLLEHGWRVDGVDFVQKAVDLARTKLANFPEDSVAIYCHDVTKLTEIDTLKAPYDLVIDMGCGHNIPMENAPEYVSDIASLMQDGAIWMLYAHEPSESRNHGWSADDVTRIFNQHFELVSQVMSRDTSVDVSSGWYQFRKRSSEAKETK